MGAILGLLDKLQPLNMKRNPAIAAVLGLVFGGLGLAIYLRSIIDFVIPVLIAVVLTITVGDLGWFIGACLASGYGYFRVVTSNERLDRTIQPGVGYHQRPVDQA
jgi:hypothetical protein